MLFSYYINGSYRDEYLKINWFLSLEDAREKIEACRQDYNLRQSHSFLDNLTPSQYMWVLETREIPILASTVLERGSGQFVCDIGFKILNSEYKLCLSYKIYALNLT